MRVATIEWQNSIGFYNTLSAFRGSGYKNYTTKSKPIRTAVQKQKRLSFAKSLIN